MATKTKANALAGVHTAGIFADMTVDGPIIGTLVVIVDRAKNLPNRKTMGKQDPYCAARLGKEAKKTTTDRRGGQTPKWDQELRYTVHDSPDYYQLKVSVFNDDKKTEVIGETWVDLKDVIVTGGGQNDLWHSLSYKGKYAGEIRIEITYYDTRPKEEKPQKVKQTSLNNEQENPREGLSGPRQPKAQAPVKRRPLPSDPVTGAPAPTVPAPIPEHVQTPPRGYKTSSFVPDQSPLQRVEYNTPPQRAPQPQTYAPSPQQDDYRQSPAVQPSFPQNGGAPRGYEQDSEYQDDFAQSPGLPNRYEQNHVQHNDFAQSPGHQTNFAPSPGTQNGYSQSNGYSNGYESQSRTINKPNKPVSNDQYDGYDQGNGYSSGNSGSYEEEYVDPRDHYNSRQATYELPQPDEFDGPPSPGGPPPPPPAHGTKHISPAPPTSSHGSYGFPENALSRSNTHDAFPEDPHRDSLPTYSQPKSYQAYSPPKEDDQFRRSANSYNDSPTRFQSYELDNDEYQPPTQRHRSYDPGYSPAHGSMQPTVEDAPPTPSPGHYTAHRSSVSRVPQYEDNRYDQVPSPAPLNLSGRGSSASGRASAISSIPSQQNEYVSTGSELSSYRDQSSVSSFRDQSALSSRTSFNSLTNYQQPQRRPSGDQMAASSNNYAMALVPTSLVPGMDPDIAKEISERIYSDKRASQMVNNPRGRYQDAPQYQSNQSRPHPLSYHEAASSTFVPASGNYDEPHGRYSAGSVAPMVKPRAVSPDPRMPARKSVSPSPAPSEGRRLSGIPFGPDSYNALNPALSGSTSSRSLSERYDPKEIDPDAKIITHDGREIDPSDHIPESNYAPLLETKQPKYASQLPDRNYRAPGSQPVAASGRRQLKVAPPRPQSNSSAGPVYSGGYSDAPTPPTGRNRLQKKTTRMATQMAPNSSPLAPITSYQDNNLTPRSLPRASTGDFSTENYSPTHKYGGSPIYRGASAGPPSIPPKIPVNYSPGGYSPGGQAPTGNDPWTLLDEMKNIDLGSGRARRRGY
ncbi:C2 domain-containing protein [Phlyctema vagabunda]|uniref:C2 domain-containing protein n=1 Tax=Phlyctema vagabunda TaxID=108571 RepID=A0ABR4PN85_9HELO